MSKSVQVRRYVIQTFCDSCRYLLSTEHGADRQEAGKCSAFVLTIDKSGAALYATHELLPDTQVLPFYPRQFGATSFGCTHWEPAEGVEVATLPTLEALDDLKRRLREWKAEYPELFTALFPQGIHNPWLAWKVTEKLRFQDGYLYMGLTGLAPTLQPLRKYAAELYESSR